MKIKKPNTRKTKSAQLKALLEIDRASNIGFATDEQRNDPAFMRRFRKFVKTGKV
jgi:hypothetical protein